MSATARSPSTDAPGPGRRRRAARSAAGAAALLAVGLVVAAAWLGWPPAPERLPLALVWPRVPRVSPETLHRWREEGRPLALFDVRTAAEHEVSRLAGAVRVEPGSAALPAVPPDAETIVLYCAVGLRSSALAARLRPRDRPLVDLDGGLFAWANRGLPMVDDAGRPTRAAHPYDRFWGLFLHGPARRA